MPTSAAQTTRVPRSAAAETATAAFAAILLGAFLLFGAGFAQSNALHQAAHDARHAFAFPCH